MISNTVSTVSLPLYAVSPIETFPTPESPWNGKRPPSQPIEPENSKRRKCADTRISEIRQVPQPDINSVDEYLKNLPAYNTMVGILKKDESVALNICRFVVRNFQSFQEKSSQKNLYVRNKEVCRPIQFNTDKSIFVHFTKWTKGQCQDFLLGKGAYKTVKIAMRFSDGNLFASLSFYKKDDYGDETAKMRIFQGLERFLQLYYEVSYTNKAGKEKKRLITELASDGDLHHVASTLTDEERNKIAGQMIEALDFLSSKGYIHRDLKMSNILVTDRYTNHVQIRITDMSSLCLPSDTTERGFYRTTPWIASPEYAKALLNLKDNGWNREAILNATTEKLDVWGVGFNLYWLYIKPPFWTHSLKHKVILTQIKNLDESWFKEPEDKNSVIHLIWEMMQIDPVKRLSSKDVKAKWNTITKTTS